MKFPSPLTKRPPQEHLFEIEQEQSIADALKPIYVIYPDETAGNWRIQAVPVSLESFESRKGLPKAWRGVRDDNLSKASAIPGGIFVHASGFIGGSALLYLYFRICSHLAPGNQTKDGALAMARAALAMEDV